MRKAFYWVEKAAYLIIGFTVTLLVLGFFKVWSFEKNNYFLFVGDYESVLVIAIVGFGATFILEKLWKWEVREIFNPKSINQRRRKR
ncbi:MAG TPA: hypothetical protein VFF13_06920 [archaeon]|nr:hypothetical protein [archaeon]